MKFNMNELRVIEKNFKNESYLNDGVKYNSIIEMKRDLIELLEMIDISDVFRELREEEDIYSIYYYNELDARFGYDVGALVYQENVKKSFARCVSRYLNKTTPEFVTYYSEFNRY